MPLPLVPIGFLVLTGGAYVAKTIRDRKSKVSPQVEAERNAVYDAAINNIKNPDQLRKLAAAFSEAGLDVQAKALCLRADNAEAPPEVKEQRKEIFRQGMESTNITAILNLANAFESQGAPAAAKALRDRAEGLRNIPHSESEPTNEQA